MKYPPIPLFERVQRINRILALSAVLAVIAVVLSLPACSSLKATPDPALVQKLIAESREHELDLVRRTVADSAREKNIVELLTSRDRLIERYVREIRSHRERMTALNADYNTPRDAFDRQLSLYNRQRAFAQAEFVDLVAAMKRETTFEEWKIISDYQVERLDVRQLTYGVAATGN
ncbi:MAG: hypothetical protein OEV41_09800 [Gammaproteobacteria bacterium]|nr:hypothetical protein [Gammaproteobacteria bacterium]